MANIRQLKRRISTSQNISKITKAMQMVAASKMKKAQDQATKARAFARALNSSLQKISNNTDPGLHPLLKKNETGFKVLLVLSTEKGLCGSFNSNLFKKVLEWLNENPDGQLILMGKKAITFAQNNGLPIYAKFNSKENPEIEDILAINQIVIDKYLSSEFSSIEILYMDFINTLSQKIRIEKLLPLQTEEIDPDGESNEASPEGEYSFEPEAKVILNELLPYYIENSLYQALLESKASEHSSRMIAMKNASDNAKDLVKDLLLIFNKSRQEAITNELLEITTANMTLKN